MSVLKKLDDGMAMFERTLVACLLIVMTCVVCYGVFERFVLQFGQGWTEEASRFLTIWATYIGASYGVRMGSHIGVDVFVDYILPARFRPQVMIVSNLCCLLFTAWITVIAMQYAMKLVGGATSPAMYIPMWTIYIAIPIGCCMMSIRYVILILTQVQTLMNPAPARES